MEKILHELFVDWKLDTWANILEVIGFLFSVGTFILGLFLKSDLDKLKSNYIFDKRVNKHIQNLNDSASNLSRFLNDYDNNREDIKSQLAVCIAELQDLTPKISFKDGYKSRNLTSFLKKRRNKPFVQKTTNESSFYYYVTKPFKRIYQTDYDDIWIIYNKLIEIIRQLENIKLNKNKSL